MSEAASTSTYVDEPFTTVFAMTHGMFPSDRCTPMYVQTLIRVQQEMDDLLIACADTHAITDADARKRLKVFNRTILDLRKEHKKNLFQDFKQEMKGKGWKSPKRSAPQKSKS